MQAEVQERIQLVGVVTLRVPLGMVEQLVVFRVLQDDVERERLDARERLAGAVPAPGGEERLSSLVSCRLKHLWFSAGTRTGRGSGSADSPACARGTRSGHAGSANGARFSGIQAG